MGRLKRLYADIGTWLTLNQAAIEAERDLAASLVTASMTPVYVPAPCERLAAAIYLLEREHQDLVARIEELFMTPGGGAVSTIVGGAFEAAGHGEPLSAARLLGSIAARVLLFKSHRSRFDGQTRLVLDVHAAVHDTITLPMLRELMANEEQLAATEQLFLDAYGPQLPSERAHPDDLLQRAAADRQLV